MVVLHALSSALLPSYSELTRDPGTTVPPLRNAQQVVRLSDRYVQKVTRRVQISHKARQYIDLAYERLSNNAQGSAIVAAEQAISQAKLRLSDQDESLLKTEGERLIKAIHQIGETHQMALEERIMDQALLNETLNDDANASEIEMAEHAIFESELRLSDQDEELLKTERDQLIRANRQTSEAHHVTREEALFAQRISQIIRITNQARQYIKTAYERLNNNPEASAIVASEKAMSQAGSWLSDKDDHLQEMEEEELIKAIQQVSETHPYEIN